MNRLRRVIVVAAVLGVLVLNTHLSAAERIASGGTVDRR